MSSGRIEAFSDGVIAVVITIMVLELKVPHRTDVAALGPLWPVFLSYVLSFIYVGIYWSNHHHMFHAVQHVNGAVLWANLHFLFWLSLIPFTTGWLGENHFASLPAAIYGANLLFAGVAYVILQRTIVVCHGPDSTLAQAIGRDFKGKLSLATYVVAIPLAFVHEGIACALYALVALVWFVPDPRIERRIV